MTSVHPVIRRQHRRSPSKAWTPVYRRVALWERRVSSHPVARVSRLAAREEQHCGPLEGANSARRLSCRLLTSGELRGEGSYSCSPRRWREKERRRERVALHLHGVPRPLVLPPLATLSNFARRTTTGGFQSISTCGGKRCLCCFRLGRKVSMVTATFTVK